MADPIFDTNLPVLRHLTYREAHLFELGLWPGAAVALALFAGEYGLALAAVSAVRRRMHDDDQREDRPDLVRGYVRDAWYFAVGAAVGFAAVFAAGLATGASASVPVPL